MSVSTTDDLSTSIQVPDALTPVTPGGLDVATPAGLDPGTPLQPPSNTEELLKTPGGLSSSFTPGASTGGSTAFRDRVVSYGMSLLGLPYVWGGTSTKTGLDCSGLILAAFGKFGYSMPRISYQQANKGAKVGINQLQVGDLVAWDENSRNVGADHIAIYIGGGRILESPHTGANVRVRKLGANEGAWGVHLSLPGDK